MNILGIETSCDETSIAIVKNGVEPIAEATASQVKLMAKYGGVVPELSARKHLEALPILFEEICAQTKKNVINSLDAIAVTVDPGLPPALSTGRAFAEGIAFGMNLPLVKVNHLDAHLTSVLLNDPLPADAPHNFASKVSYPHIALLVSGGHTNLFLSRSPVKYDLLGKTRDDAAGEAFDKVARMLGLGYPGGPEISKLAEKHENENLGAEAEEKRADASYPPGKASLGLRLSENPFTVPLSEEPFDFSFSGLKTAVRRLIVSLANNEMKKVPKDVEIERLGRALGCAKRAEIAHYFQQTVISTLIQKTLNAEKKYKTGLITLTGGVAANKKLRHELARACSQVGARIKYPRLNRCTDNATMVASAGHYVFGPQ